MFVLKHRGIWAFLNKKMGILNRRNPLNSSIATNVASHMLQFCLQALSRTNLIGFWQTDLSHDWKNRKNTQEIIPLKAIPINLWSEQLKIYKEKKFDKWGGEVVVIYWWLSEFYIIVACKKSRLIERHTVELEIE